MADITITINNAIIADVRDRLCNRWGYPGDMGDTNAKNAFLKSYLAAWVKNEYREQKANEDVATSYEAVRQASLAATVNTDIT
jgi:hypothetical protein